MKTPTLVPNARWWRLACSLGVVAVLSAASCATPVPDATPPAIEASPVPLDFGVVPARATKTLALVVRNAGGSALSITSATLSGPSAARFSLTASPATLAAGEQLSWPVTFAGDVLAAEERATLLIASDAPDQPALSVELFAETRAPACDDGILNGAETDLDCGASCPTACGEGARCLGAFDCGPEFACRGGVCAGCSNQGDCRPGRICLAERCVACTTDSQCRQGQTCAAGACTDCPDEAEPIDTQVDVNHCGACKNACPVPQHATARCTTGRCGRTPCEPGHYDLDGATRYGCEVTCAGRACTDDSGVSFPVSTLPLPEAGLTHRAIATGSSIGGAIQTSTGHSNTGLLGEATPRPASTETPMHNARYTNKSGFIPTLGR